MTVFQLTPAHRFRVRTVHYALPVATLITRVGVRLALQVITVRQNWMSVCRVHVLTATAEMTSMHTLAHAILVTLASIVTGMMMNV